MTVSEINFTTTKLIILDNQDEVGTASGFFFKHRNIKYLVTNRHVVIDDDFKPTHLSLNLHFNKFDLTNNHEVLVSLYEDDCPNWKLHPDYDQNLCDIVLIPLDSNTLQHTNFELFNSAVVTFINSELINTKPVNPFGSLAVVGYPLGFYDETNNLPVYRNATIASEYGVNFGGLPYFLIDTKLHEGTSGSPVVNSHHTLFKQQGINEGYALFGVHSAEHVIDGDPLGLNVVWYANNLVEISES